MLQGQYRDFEFPYTDLDAISFDDHKLLMTRVGDERPFATIPTDLPNFHAGLIVLEELLRIHTEMPHEFDEETSDSD